MTIRKKKFIAFYCTVESSLSFCYFYHSLVKIKQTALVTNDVMLDLGGITWLSEINPKTVPCDELTLYICTLKMCKLMDDSCLYLLIMDMFLPFGEVPDTNVFITFLSCTYF